MIRPERRTRGDLIAAAAIAAVVLMVIATFWWRSSERATISRPATAAAPSTSPAGAVPPTLQQRWTAASSRTLTPIVLGGNVITGDGSTMAGLDPKTGEQRWSYARDTDLCGVSYVYELAVAVYPDVRGCGQVSGINAATGRRGPTRTSYADDVVVLSSDGSAVLSTGATRLELWRSDLVRMLSYGEIDGPVKPVNTKLGTGCALMSASASDAAVGVLESCRDQKDLRLTLLKPAKEEDEPDVKKVPLAGVAVDSDARVIAVVGTRTAVYLPTPNPQVVVYDDTGSRISSTVMPGPPMLNGPAPAVTRAGDQVTWWTGNAVMVFDNKLSYRYTLGSPGPLTALGSPGPLAALGPATMMAGRLLVAVPDGLAVFNDTDGAFERVITLRHPDGESLNDGAPVIPAISGSMVIEQHGTAVAGYAPA